MRIILDRHYSIHLMKNKCLKPSLPNYLTRFLLMLMKLFMSVIICLLCIWKKQYIIIYYWVSLCSSAFSNIVLILKTSMVGVLANNTTKLWFIVLSIFLELNCRLIRMYCVCGYYIVNITNIQEVVFSIQTLLEDLAKI
jgi:hypothetical protein